MLASVLAVVAFAAQGQTTTRDAPWQLTGISPDQRTLHLVYEGGGCLARDGRAERDTSDPATVRIAVRQTAAVGAYAICPAFYAFYPLDVDLGAPLAGRTVTGGPRLTTVDYVRTMPRLVGLRRADARRALRQQGINAKLAGRRRGVVTLQSPRPGRKLGGRRRAFLQVGSFDARDRLSVSVPDGQTVESVLRRGLRFRYALDPAAERALDALLDCNGQDGGEAGRVTQRDSGAARVPIANGDLRRALRRRARSTCRLTVLSFPPDARGINDWLVRRTVRVTLTHR